jgi:hypothetical protein
VLILLFSPILVVIMKTSYTALKIFCIVAVVTQVLTLPLFFLTNNSLDWKWSGVNPFGFTFLETVLIIGKVALFLYALVVFVSYLHRFSIRKRRAINLISSNSTQNKALQLYTTYNIRKNSSILITVTIIVLISGLVSLNLWTYSQGIGITGVEPPRLPYRLSGILFYFTKYLTPALLAYLYFRTKRGWTFALIFLCYAWILGLSAASKGAVLIVMAPVIALAWIDKRYIMLLFCGVGTLYGVTVASGVRAYVHFVENGITGADTSFNLFQLIDKVLFNLNGNVWFLDFILLMFTGIAARVEAFENLVLAQYYDPNAVIGAGGFALRMIWAGWVSFPMDAHHIEWTGSILPVGFYSGGSILSNTIIMSNGGLWWVIVSAMITAASLVIIEKTVDRFVQSYKQLYYLRVSIIFVLTLLYFIESTASRVFITILVLLTISILVSPLLKNIFNNKT